MKPDLINKITLISDLEAEDRKKDPELAAKMEFAAQGQSPDFLLISPIHHGLQDLQILSMLQGDAFQGTRVTGEALLPPEKSPLLFAGPAAYNGHFPESKGTIITFEHDESSEVIAKSLSSLSQHPDVQGLPMVALRINYSSSEVAIEPHARKRDVHLEETILSKTATADGLDHGTLVLLCSDSRIRPPRTPIGVPLSIQTLGGHIPEYSGMDDESAQLDNFLSKWLKSDRSEKHIMIIEHGGFEKMGPSCGAGQASLSPSTVSNDYLHPVIAKIARDATQFEDIPASTAEQRVLASARATEANLRSYPAIQQAEGFGVDLDKMIIIATMDTVSLIVREIG